MKNSADNIQQLKTTDFSYILPEELIAQRPLAERDKSRLLCLDKNTSRISHRIFHDLPEILRPGDRLVFNDTRVIPARLFCIKSTGAKVEMLFVKRIDDATWNVLALPAKRLKKSTEIMVEEQPKIRMKVLDVLPDGSRNISLIDNDLVDNIDGLIEKYGHMPLPHYIKRDADSKDRESYQTIYARNPGAVAAPTAGLHFTPQLMARLKKNGIDISFVTLHVGIGTFKPVSEEDPHNHHMHFEHFNLSRETVDEIARTRENAGRIIAVGTTTVRVLEHCARETGSLAPLNGSTDLFILPGYDFKVINGMITNFHLPQSTLLMLVSAFIGRETVLQAYQTAIRERYRFFSYGDVMFIA